MNTETVKCAKCGFEAKNELALRMHNMRKHGKLRGDTRHLAKHLRAKGKQYRGPNRVVKDPMPCPECGFICNGLMGLGVHRKSQHGIVGASRAAGYARLAYHRRKQRVQPFVLTNEMEASVAGEIHPAQNGTLLDKVADRIAEKLLAKLI